MPHRSIARVLESDAQFAAWTARARQEAALTRLVRKHLPRPIAERVRASAAGGAVLELAASGSAIATALRQRAPALQAALSRDGCNFTEVRVRVQVVAHAPAELERPSHQWDSARARPLFDLADRLSDGPLKSALARWSRRARGR